MVDARRRESSAKRARVLATLSAMLADGDSITAAALARRAQVSTWLVYAPGIRDAVDTARAHQQHPDVADRPPGRGDTGRGDSGKDIVAALRTDLALARAEITRLRGESAQHTEQLRRALGTQLDTRTKSDLVARIDELTRANTDLTIAAGRRESTIDALRSQVAALEDDLTAARTSLRRMIRADNLPPTR